MDLLSLDSIIITEDKDGSGGFDLNLVDPPEEFMSQEDSIEIQSADPVNLKDIETEGGFDSTPPPNDVNIFRISIQVVFLQVRNKDLLTSIIMVEF
jgi:hypothetical protein